MSFFTKKCHFCNLNLKKSVYTYFDASMRIYENQPRTASSIDKLTRFTIHALTDMEKNSSENIKASVKNHHKPFDFVDKKQ